MYGKEVRRYTVEDIIEQRNKALKDVRECGQEISRKLRLLFEPPKTSGKFDLLANNIDRILAVYDGIMLGSKIIRKFRRFVFRK